MLCFMVKNILIYFLGVIISLFCMLELSYAQNYNLWLFEKEVNRYETIDFWNFSTNDIWDFIIQDLNFFIKWDNRANEYKVYLNWNQIWNKIVSHRSYDVVEYKINNVVFRSNTTYNLKIEAVWYYWNEFSGFYVKKNIFNSKPIINDFILSTNDINENNHLNIWYSITWITDNDVNTSLNLLISKDWVNYNNFTNINQPVINNVDLEGNINLSDVSSWEHIIYIKWNDGLSDSNILTFVISKTLLNPSINITQTIVDQDIKSIKINMQSDYWMRFMNINSDWSCDNSLSFIDYWEIIFDLASDNWKYVCYKVDLGYWNEHFKVSNKINWILWKMESWEWDVFYAYTNWRTSSHINSNDKTLSFLKMTQSTSSNSWSITKNYPSTLIDINWDGLIDMLYSKCYSWVEVRYENNWNDYNYTIHQYKYAIMINNGDYTFEPVYRCVIDDWKYYGDCVQ